MQENNVSKLNFEACQKCSICNTVCPMMAANPLYPGPKKAGPDQERYRIKDPEFYDYALKYCLGCKRCEVACPSGVQVSDLIQRARLQYAPASKHPLRDAMLANTDFVGSLASPFAPIVNEVLPLKPVKAVLDGAFGIDSHRTFPKYSAEKFTTWFARHAKKQQESFDRFVTYYHGCYANYNYPQLAKDFVKVMNAAGYGVHLLEKERCCGVALVANGFEKQAVKQAKVNIASMEKAVAGGEPVLTTSSSCTLMMSREYGEVLGLPTEGYRDSLSLVCKWLYEKIESGEVKLKFRKDFRMKLSYHTACHMQRLGWQNYTIELLRMIPGVRLTVLDQNCCGISGTFGFKKEYYPYSQKVGSVLFEDIRTSNPEAVVTECETCKWQIEMSAGIPVLNPISVLAAALD